LQKNKLNPKSDLYLFISSKASLPMESTILSSQRFSNSWRSIGIVAFSTLDTLGREMLLLLPSCRMRMVEEYLALFFLLAE
jgi:hypothetical protein